jgi:uncharacterized protein YcbX
MSDAGLVEIWRYPVKSFQGEQLPDVTIDAGGTRGDRSWGVRDQATGRILTGRREPHLLLAGASLTAGDEPELTLPDGVRCRGSGARTDALLSSWLGRPVSLVPAAGELGATAEYFADATDDTSQPIEWTMPPERFVDAMPLLVLTTSSLRAGAHLYPAGQWHPRRFRPNLLIDLDTDGWVEDGWCGRTVRIGDVELVPREPCVRCTMVTRPQPGIDRDLDIYKTVSRHHGGTLGVWTEVRAPGTVRIGDRVEIAA